MLFLRYCWPAILWSLIILIVTLIPGEAVPEVGIFGIDKVVHFALFGMVMLLSSIGLKKWNDITSSSTKPFLLTALYSIGLGILIEILQLFVPGRSFSFADMIANSVGVGLGYLAFLFIQKRILI
jgi:VanZ family protein